MGLHPALTLFLGLLLAAPPRPPVHIRPQGHGTLQVLGYDPANQCVYYVEERGHAREPSGVYECALGDRYPEMRTRVPASGDDAVRPDSLERTIRRLRARLTPLSAATLYDLSVQTWLTGMDTVATSHGPLVRSHLGVDLREGDLHARAGIVTSCEERTGVTALYRIPQDRRALAILAFTGIPDSECVDVEEPMILALPDTTARHRSWSPPSMPLEGSATLTGRVANARGNPLEMACVVVQGTKLWAYTDADGWYTLHGIPPGARELVINAFGYNNLKLSDTLAAGPNAPLIVEMPPPLPVSDRSDYSGRCEPWFGVSMYQGDQGLRPGAMLIDAVGNVNRATITRPEGALTISAVEDPCALAISWTPAGPTSATVLILDERGNVVREYRGLSADSPTRLQWDGRDARAARCPRGSYMVQVRTGGTVLALECGRVGT
jgi:hypothetical protein